jgi:hypothetical protein
MTLPKGYVPPPAEKERIERLEREHQRQLSLARGIDVEYDRRRQQAVNR